MREEVKKRPFPSDDDEDEELRNLREAENVSPLSDIGSADDIVEGDGGIAQVATDIYVDWGGHVPSTSDQIASTSGQIASTSGQGKQDEKEDEESVHSQAPKMPIEVEKHEVADLKAPNQEEASPSQQKAEEGDRTGQEKPQPFNPPKQDDSGDEL